LGEEIIPEQYWDEIENVEMSDCVSRDIVPPLSFREFQTYASVVNGGSGEGSRRPIFVEETQCCHQLPRDLEACHQTGEVYSTTGCCLADMKGLSMGSGFIYRMVGPE